MPHTFLSPTNCAERVLDELVAVIEKEGPLAERRPLIIKLIRQMVRDQYEHCAQLAECFVPEEDLNEGMTGLEVGDGVAEKIRKIADERVLAFSDARRVGMQT